VREHIVNPVSVYELIWWTNVPCVPVPHIIQAIILICSWHSVRSRDVDGCDITMTKVQNEMKLFMRLPLNYSTVQYSTVD
jgi:hypothetical protein